MQLTSKKAFSLIELSIVILIIGIIIAGITSSSSLVGKFRISSARSLTVSSPVHGIRDLEVWYEPVLENSFTNAQMNDATPVDTWFDQDQQAVTKNNATATTTTRPTFRENILNGLPAVRFDGVDDLMPFNGGFVINSSYTAFVVEIRRWDIATTPKDQMFFGGSAGVGGGNLVLGYSFNPTNNIKVGHFGDDLNYTDASLARFPVARMHTAVYENATRLRRYWLNGGNNPEQTNTAAGPLTSWAGSALGRYGTDFYQGDLFEIIMFSRALTTEERQSIEAYLSKKYGITIS